MTIRMANLEGLTLVKMEETVANNGAPGMFFWPRVTGHSRAQMARLVRHWMDQRRLEPKVAKRACFARCYTAGETALLPKVDAAHEDLSGPSVALHHGTGVPRYRKIRVQSQSGVKWRTLNV